MNSFPNKQFNLWIHPQLRDMMPFLQVEVGACLDYLHISIPLFGNIFFIEITIRPPLMGK